ncbi:Alpha/Beta hydrolase protein [Lipomyces japonicus]|uniref:Alpha/Beta hydrolase protein n=1 Tax=Lipomyces japonicus TaxID=56871 RepID=UPI0034CD6A89
MDFPLDFRSAVRDWWHAVPLGIAEHRVLSFLPFYPAPDDSRQAESLMVELTPGRSMNEFQITRTTSEPVTDELVVLHGYGAGLAFFYRNLDSLSSIPGLRVHALDFLGYGRSSRPRFRIQAKTKLDAVVESESWFVDSLEEWRLKRGIDRFTLMAHSMGGYLGVAYALKHPDRVKKLVLVSPVGVPRNPWPEHDDTLPVSAITTELTQSQEQATQVSSSNSSALSSSSSSSSSSVNRRAMPKWLVFLWERHVSPFSFVRFTGPFGQQLVALWTSHRFSMLPMNEARALHDYVYSLFSMKGSGEYAITRMLAPGAYARMALIDRIQNLKIPTLWMYGERDWMDVHAGRQARDLIRANGTKSELVVVPRSGHHLYLDNPDEFNRIVKQELQKS